MRCIYSRYSVSFALQWGRREWQVKVLQQLQGGIIEIILAWNLACQQHSIIRLLGWYTPIVSTIMPTCPISYIIEGEAATELYLLQLTKSPIQSSISCDRTHSMHTVLQKISFQDKAGCSIIPFRLHRNLGDPAFTPCAASSVLQGMLSWGLKAVDSVQQFHWDWITRFIRSSHRTHAKSPKKDRLSYSGGLHQHCKKGSGATSESGYNVANKEAHPKEQSFQIWLS